MDVDDAWSVLIQHSVPKNVTEPHNYAQTDEVFVRWWKHAIDQYRVDFHRVDPGPHARRGQRSARVHEQLRPLPPFTSPIYPVDCSAAIYPRSCEAKAEIISYFIAATGPNGKATLVGGLTASSDIAFGDIGMSGVKLVTSLSPPFGPPAIFGGAEVDHPISGKRATETGDGMSDRQGAGQKTLQRVSPKRRPKPTCFTIFFTARPPPHTLLQAPQFAGSGDVGNEQGTVEFLWVPYLDILYATANKCLDEKKILRGDTSVQDQLDSASYYLLMMAGQPEPQLPPACVISSGP